MVMGYKEIKLKSLFTDFSIAAVLILEIIIFSQVSPYFLTTDNILNISLQASITAIIAAGMTFVILTAGIDLSVGSIVAFAGIITTSLLKLDINPVWSLLPGNHCRYTLRIILRIYCRDLCNKI